MTTQPIKRTATPTITERLADHIVGLRYGDIPSAVIQKAKDHLVHHLGTALRGHGASRGRQAVGLAVELSGSSGGCSIVGDHRPAHLLEAIFANSFLMSVGGPNDVLMPYGVNPGVITQPVAWAVGQQTAASGQQLLAAVIVGYDAMARVSDPAWSWGANLADRPALYRPKHVLAPIGAAATTARLLGLSREQTVHALGHAGQGAMSILEGQPSGQLITLHPLLAQNGALAATLAKQGLPASRTVLEGEHGVFRSFFLDTTDFIEAGLATLGKQFAMTEAWIERHSASIMDAVPIELTQKLIEQHTLAADDIATVNVTVHQERKAREQVREATAFHPDAGRTRHGNLRFQIAAIVADGHSNPARFDEPPDREFLAVLDKISLRYEPDRPVLYARVDIDTVDGQHHTAEGDTPAHVPVDWATALDAGAHQPIPAPQLAHLAEYIRHLEDVADVSEVMTCVVPGASP